MKSFTPTQEMIDAAMTVFKAQAIEQTIRPIVEGYMNKILAEREWPVCEKYHRLEGKLVKEIQSTFLMNQEDFAVFHQRCNEERIKSRLHVELPEQCPLLIAQHALMDAKFALAKIMEPITKITEEQLRGAACEYMNEYMKLTLSLLAPHVDIPKKPF